MLLHLTLALVILLTHSPLLFYAVLLYFEVPSPGWFRDGTPDGNLWLNHRPRDL